MLEVEQEKRFTGKISFVLFQLLTVWDKENCVSDIWDLLYYFFICIVETDFHMLSLADGFHSVFPAMQII